MSQNPSASGPSERRRRLLAAYARVSPALQPPSERRFLQFLATCVLAALGLGALLSTLAPLPVPAPRAAPARAASFRLVALPRAATPGEVAPVATPIQRAPMPQAARSAAGAARQSAPSDATAPATGAPSAAGPAPARRVYGVREVYARGLGGAGGAGALVVKPGNGVDGRADSLRAQPADLVPGGGGDAAAPAISQPLPLALVKPRYSEAMLAARAQGAVRLRLLVGEDGAVEDLEVLEDIGYDSAALAAAAARQFRFAPAKRGDERLSAWIEYTIRFALEDE